MPCKHGASSFGPWCILFRSTPCTFMLLIKTLVSLTMPRAPNEHCPRTCTAGTVALTSVLYLLAEVDTALLNSTVA